MYRDGYDDGSYGDYEPTAEDWKALEELRRRMAVEELLAEAGYADPIGMVDELIASGVPLESVGRRDAA